MNKLIFLILFLLSVPCLTFSQGWNVDLVSNTTITQDASDIWGFVDSNGNEYAILGSYTRTNIYSLSDTTNPVLVTTIAGANSIWRDIKVFGDYIYVVADRGTNGLLIINMSNAPSVITHTFWKPSITVGSNTTTLQRCHNLYIDDDGTCYLSGCNVSSGGALIIDITTDPMNPVHLGTENVAYSHDVYVRDDTLFTSEIWLGRAGIYDVTDNANPMLIATQTTGTDFTHNIWLSDDGNTMYTTDERANAYTEAYDISDLDNIELLDRYRSLATGGLGVIPHNVHVFNDFLVISNYTDGVRIVDAARPNNLIEVGYYDTWSGGSNGYNGCWGAYPFLPSGLLLLSDIQTGLYVLNPTYKRACYLEGVVRDTNSLLPINGVDVQILAAELNEGLTDASGIYATGIVDTGDFQVVYSHPMYTSDTVWVHLDSGQVTIQDVYLGEYCLETIITNDTLFSEQLVARQWIQSDAIINFGDTVRLSAQDSIILNFNFEVPIGSVFTIDTIGCGLLSGH